MDIQTLLPLPRMDELADQKRTYQNARPFPHIVIDDFLPPAVIAQLTQDFPGPQDHAWLKYRTPSEKDKLQSTSELAMPASIRQIVQAFNSSTFVKFLEELTGIDAIIPDPHLFGGGMHQTLTGGHLSMHVDYNMHERWNLDRRLNAILYLNTDWREEWGGALELWEGTKSELKESVVKIFPVANRMVIFSTNETSWHGHPDPLSCPADRSRRSLAFYYYTNGRPEDEQAGTHTTRFVGRPGEHLGQTFRQAAHDWVPPIAFKLLRRLRRHAA